MKTLKQAVEISQNVSGAVYTTVYWAVSGAVYTDVDTDVYEAVTGAVLDGLNSR